MPRAEELQQAGPASPVLYIPGKALVWEGAKGEADPAAPDAVEGDERWQELQEALSILVEMEMRKKARLGAQGFVPTGGKEVLEAAAKHGRLRTVAEEEAEAIVRHAQSNVCTDVT